MKRDRMGAGIFPDVMFDDIQDIPERQLHFFGELTHTTVALRKRHWRVVVTDREMRRINTLDGVLAAVRPRTAVAVSMYRRMHLELWKSRVER